MDQAGHCFNYGLRSYYFGMAVLAWFVSPCLFIVSVGLVVAVLNQGKFCSPVLTAMMSMELAPKYMPFKIQDEQIGI